jgi:ribokinase
MPRIVVVGSVNLDIVAHCDRLPLPGETVGGGVVSRHPGGKGANQALAARRMGAEVSLVSRVGDDANADEALALLINDGVDVARVERDANAPTGVALIVVDRLGENQIVVAPGANALLAPEDVDLAGADAVVSQLETPMETVEAAAIRAPNMFCLNASPIMPLPDVVLGRADLIVVNEHERAELEANLSGFDGLVAVTSGAAGAVLLRRGLMVAKAVPPRVHPIDTVGAGDAFMGAFVVAMVEERPMQEALERACAAGALATTRPGAQPSLPTAAEVDAL